MNCLSTFSMRHDMLLLFCFITLALSVAGCGRDNHTARVERREKAPPRPHAAVLRSSDAQHSAQETTAPAAAVGWRSRWWKHWRTQASMLKPNNAC